MKKKFVWREEIVFLTSPKYICDGKILAFTSANVLNPIMIRRLINR
jgi:hypothetical protein